MRNSASRHFKTHTFTKGYFDAPESDLEGFQYGKELCPICQETKTKFVLSPKKCCLDCLQKSDFKFIHDSEFGVVTVENQPFELSDEHNIKKHVSDDRIEALCRTPNFTNIQGGVWQIHCHDFMVFIGIWEPADFTEKSPDKNGKSLFLEMTEETYNHLWDSCELADAETKNCWEDVFYYAFECKHCGKLKGYWDCT
jgi:uncharacterized protein CbrC (UPF0167 family)